MEDMGQHPTTACSITLIAIALPSKEAWQSVLWVTLLLVTTDVPEILEYVAMVWYYPHCMISSILYIYTCSPMQSQDMMDAQREPWDLSTPPLSMRGEWKCVQMECGEQSVVWIAGMLLSYVQPWGTVEVRGTEYLWRNCIINYNCCGCMRVPNDCPHQKFYNQTCSILNGFSHSTQKACTQYHDQSYDIEVVQYIKGV